MKNLILIFIIVLFTACASTTKVSYVPKSFDEAEHWFDSIHSNVPYKTSLSNN